MNAFMSELVLQSVGLACVLFINILSIRSWVFWVQFKSESRWSILESFTVRQNRNRNENHIMKVQYLYFPNR
jgi:hypothetical protein